ncbi:hypothetical protein B0H12DRAFT_1098463 [Mycena haematopus]|nr:hypothetical protein B0H12DRAFT_1098463 [Mycena haematopus]
MACLPTHRHCVTSATEAPVILGHICSLWRTISFSMPRLWSRLHISQPPYKAKVAPTLEASNAWLKRSGNCALTISLQTSIRYSPESDQLLNLLVLHASRWQNVCLTIPFAVLESLSELTENDVPLLKDLQLFLHPENIRDIPAWDSIPV